MVINGKWESNNGGYGRGVGNKTMVWSSQSDSDAQQTTQLRTNLGFLSKLSLYMFELC